VAAGLAYHPIAMAKTDAPSFKVLAENYRREAEVYNRLA
jgi:hypothetical protein